MATRIARDADIGTGDIQDPGVTHRYIAQVAQTDWEFLKGRAAEIGYEVGVAEGDLYFRPAPGMSAGGLGGAASAAASAVGLGGCTLTFGDNLRWLRPRISSAGLTQEAEVRVWDPESKGVVAATASLGSETADVDAPFPLAADPTITERQPLVSVAGDSFLVGYQTFFDTRLVSVDPSTGTFCEEAAVPGAVALAGEPAGDAALLGWGWQSVDHQAFRVVDGTTRDLGGGCGAGGTAFALDDQIVAGEISVWAGVAVAGNRAKDEPRVEGVHGVIAKAKGFHRARPEIFHHHIGGFQHLAHNAQCFFMF